MNIAEILKDAPRGTKLYSIIHGEVTLSEIDEELALPIVVEDCYGKKKTFTKDGKYHNYYDNGECVLLPSATERNWATFKIEPQFPTSIDKCSEVLDLNVDNEDWYKESEINALRKLLIARDAWWKLDDNWKPDYAATNLKYAIGVVKGEVHRNSVTRDTNKILVFRTPELRDGFLETFRDLIEKCKELI